MSEDLYYTPPSDEAFQDMKDACMKVWGKYSSSEGGYMEEKLSRIRDIQNIQDNFMYMLAMFDEENQTAAISLLKEETKDAVRERMIAGGNEDWMIRRIGL
jgi:hypothetical protein